MLKISIVAILMLLSGPAFAQVGPNPVIYVPSAPSGSCASNVIQYVTIMGTLYTCQSGTWAILTGAAWPGYPAGTGIPTVTTGSAWGTTFAPTTGYIPFGASGVFGQDSGLFWDNAAKALNVTGNVTVGTTVATDQASVGPELLDATGWTSTGWTSTFNTFAHTAGNTSALSRAITGIGAGSCYLVSIVISGSSAGSVTASIGGSPVSPGGVTVLTGNVSNVAGPRATGTGAFTITPTSDFNGTVALSVKLISPISGYKFSLLDSTGNVSAGILQQNYLAGNLFIGNENSDIPGRFNVPLFSGYTAGPPGTANTGIGIATMIQNTTGFNNTAVGQVALSQNTTGGQNTAVGVDSMAQNISGSYDTAMGSQALGFNTTGNGSAAFGTQALYSNTTGSNNVAIGNGALFTTTTVSNLTAVGQSALYSNTSGTQNTAIGSNALTSNTTGVGNTAVGSSALQRNTTNTGNTAIGSGALGNSDGGANTAVGASALGTMTSGFNNTSLGYNAAGSLTNDGNSVVLGYSAAPNGGGQSVVIGANAGGTIGLGKNNNTVIGYAANVAAAASVNEIVIGASAIGSGSNTAVIGAVGTTDVYFGSATGAAKAHMASIITTKAAPAASTDACTAGEAWKGTISSTSYLFYCVASGNIGRVAFTTGW